MSKVGKTLWLSSLPYPFTAFFSSLKKRQSVLLITAIMALQEQTPENLL
jgi:hypothetical protein